MSFQFRRTQHGGHSGGKGNKAAAKTILRPIAKWLQRRVFFLCGGRAVLEGEDMVCDNGVSDIFDELDVDEEDVHNY